MMMILMMVMVVKVDENNGIIGIEEDGRKEEALAEQASKHKWLHHQHK